MAQKTEMFDQAEMVPCFTFLIFHSSSNASNKIYIHVTIVSYPADTCWQPGAGRPLQGPARNHQDILHSRGEGEHIHPQGEHKPAHSLDNKQAEYSS
jgi:hypothetical protein